MFIVQMKFQQAYITFCTSARINQDNRLSITGIKLNLSCNSIEKMSMSFV